MTESPARRVDGRHCSGWNCMNQAQQFGIIFSVVFTSVTVILIYWYLLIRRSAGQHDVDLEMVRVSRRGSVRSLEEARSPRETSSKKIKQSSRPESSSSSIRRLQSPPGPNTGGNMPAPAPPALPLPTLPGLPNHGHGTLAPPPVPPSLPPVMPPFPPQQWPAWYTHPWSHPIVIPSHMPVPPPPPPGVIPSQAPGLLLDAQSQIPPPPPPPPSFQPAPHIGTIDQQLQEYPANLRGNEWLAGRNGPPAPGRDLAPSRAETIHSDDSEIAVSKQLPAEPSAQTSDERPGPQKQAATSQPQALPVNKHLIPQQRTCRDSSTSLGLKLGQGKSSQKPFFEENGVSRMQLSGGLANRSPARWEPEQDNDMGALNHFDETQYGGQQGATYQQNNNVTASPSGSQQSDQTKSHQSSPDVSQNHMQSPTETMPVFIPRLFSLAQDSEASNTVISTRATTGHSTETLDDGENRSLANSPALSGRDHAFSDASRRSPSPEDQNFRARTDSFSQRSLSPLFSERTRQRIFRRLAGSVLPTTIDGIPEISGNSSRTLDPSQQMESRASQSTNSEMASRVRSDVSSEETAHRSARSPVYGIPDEWIGSYPGDSGSQPQSMHDEESDHSATWRPRSNMDGRSTYTDGADARRERRRAHRAARYRDDGGI